MDLVKEKNLIQHDIDDFKKEKDVVKDKLDRLFQENKDYLT